RRARTEGQPGRPDQQRLDHGEEPAGVRAHRLRLPAPVILCAVPPADAGRERMAVWEDEWFQDRYTRLRLDLEDHKALYGEFVAKVYRGEALGPDVSMLKVHQTELFQRITETMLEIAGEHGGQFGPLDGNRELNPAGLFIQSRPASIYAGSNEIQRNILAKNVLELP